ncbi:beta-ketoacyl-[acyl-carrier-protein] synthase family protein [Micromonospora echinaurantiaca]|uniref:beta-ketoacyl-[acyl-carrier-protein] synthase family protein n=1 Tax=Micromonospora echinaurantiaca TaxID=47857 RepID=UPI000B5AC823|nr:beta-ketoacyl-[acyl-carrier-protein] synthase family protein [Micromonospora echinaurantiaca]
MRRVVITGLGPVSNIGIGAAAFESGLRGGHNGISAITSFDTAGFPRTMAGEVRAFEPEPILRRLDTAAWGRSSLFAAAAARLAVRDAGLRVDRVPPHRVGVAVGTTSGESKVTEEMGRRIVDHGFPALPGDLAEHLPAGRLAAAVSEELGVTGESVTLATACSASNYALGYAYDLVANGDADVMLTGGADSVCRWAHAGFVRLGAVADKACAPFDRDRSGMITAEGGAMLLLESADHARARGATPYAEVLGYGLNCDARHMVAPDAASIAECMRLAHRNAGVRPDDIDYVCAHGTGTAANDATEAAALEDAFDGRVPPVSSIKSMLGHTMGAASAFGVMAAALAIARGFLPPTINWSNPDPAMARLDPIPNHARPARVRVAQNNGFAFGGNNAIVLLGAVS